MCAELARASGNKTEFLGYVTKYIVTWKWAALCEADGKLSSENFVKIMIEQVVPGYCNVIVPVHTQQRHTCEKCEFEATA